MVFGTKNFTLTSLCPQYCREKARFERHPSGVRIDCAGHRPGPVSSLKLFSGLPIPLGDRLVSPISYRWLNAVAGATLPGLTLLLGFLSERHTLPSTAAGVCHAGRGNGACSSVCPLVESRLALINIYWVWFGVCGQLCWVLAKTGDAESEVKTPELKSVSLTVKRPLVPISWGYANRLWHQSRLSQDSSPARLRSQTVWWRVAAGVSLGAAINVKWNGAGFWLGILLLELAGWQPVPKHRQSVPWQALLLYLGIVPLVTYSLLWIPHLRLNQVFILRDSSSAVDGAPEHWGRWGGSPLLLGLV